ncbi:Glycine--tRNA ligase beta subunit [Frankliniella fusca]|uniref:Glycine--tRNA ligase beta subunit n=1 Tax=Frankliniella fusca TaxID=407009 RepID=A0AAE1GV44_9NEOP|nr:Glycine--tRNA ligase beta subunit [Frankliniella fusca]
MGVRLRQEPPFADIATEVSSKILALWEAASIPTVSQQCVRDRITNLHKKYTTLRAYLRSSTTTQTKKDEKTASFKEEFSQLFDIASCKCKDLSFCICPKDKRVPPLEHAFFLDKKGPRRMAMARVDHAETKKLRQRAERTAKRMRLEQKVERGCEPSTSFSPQITDTRMGDGSDGDEDDPPEVNVKAKPDDSDDDVHLPLRLARSQAQTLQARLDLSETTVVAQRYGLSLRATAHVSSTVLLSAKKAGLISEEVSDSLVIDKSKIKRGNAKIGAKLKQKSRTDVPLRGLYFDGRKDDTLTASGFVKEEHISLVAKPGSKYIGHVATTSGHAANERNAIYNNVTSEVTGGFDEVVVLGCDGTNTNTGWKAGIMRKLEEKVGRPLQWIVCLLHFNELPFRHLLIHIDGPTSGPNKFSGPIGQLLPNCETLDVVKFKAVECNLPEMDLTDFSSDQKYLFQIADAIRSGTCSPELASRKPGPINMARWLTTANRIVRLYISTKKPTKKLQVLVQYLLSVYVPLWFTIRKNKSITEGTRHLFQAIKLSRFLPVKYREVVDNTIQTNAFFALPENVLLAMVTDSRLTVRQDALAKILQAKTEQSDTAFKQ